MRRTRYEPKQVTADPLWTVETPLNGADGRDGMDGKDGHDGIGVDGASLNPRGDFHIGEIYRRNDLVREDDASYVCLADATKSVPSPQSKSWMLLCRDGETPETPEVVIHAQRSRSAEPTPFTGNTVKAVFDSAAVRGNVVRVSGTRRVDLALAHGSDAPALAIGLSNGAYGPGQQGSYTTSGPFTCEAWNFTPGECMYLSPTVPGGLTNVFPDTFDDRVIILGMMLTPTTINLKIHWAAIIGS